MPNQKYDKSKLDLFLEKSEASLISYNGKLIGSTKIKFNCKCGNLFEKVFREGVESGFKCGPCMKQQKITNAVSRRYGNLDSSKSLNSCVEKMCFFTQELNHTVDPKCIPLNSGKSLFWKCQDCSHIWESSPHQLNKCPYCVNQTLCANNSCLTCFNKSLAYKLFMNFETFLLISNIHSNNIYNTLFDPFINETHLFDFKKNTLSPRQIFANSSRECWFLCRLCLHSFEARPCRFNDSLHCPFCSPICAKQLCPQNNNCIQCIKRSFGSSPYISWWNHEKNDSLSPFEIFLSGTQQIWLNCPDCNLPFQRSCNQVTCGTLCPNCPYLGERLLNILLNDSFSYLNSRPQLPLEFLRNPNTGCLRKFDSASIVYKISFEVDGPSHFEQVSNWTDPDINSSIDVWKMKQAINNCWSGIRILEQTIVKQKNQWPMWIEHAIKLILEAEEPIWVFPPDALYEIHISKCKSEGIKTIALNYP